MKTINRKCPICHSENHTLIKKIEFLLFDGHIMGDGYDLVQCNNCSFVFANTNLSQIQLDDYYANLSIYEDKQLSTGGGFNSYDRERLIVTAKYLSSQFQDKDISIVDVGCASGGLLEQLRYEGFNNLTGIDPSASCVKITKEEKNTPCFQASIFDLDKKYGQYDLVILSHVWEHIIDLENALISLETILKPNGFIYIECPDAMKYQEVIHAPFQEFNTEHINHFFSTAYENYFGLRNYNKVDIGSKKMKLASNEDYFAVYGVFQKLEQPSKYTVKFDDEIINAIRAYIEKSDSLFNRIVANIKNAISENSQIAFVGIGQFAFKLLKVLSSFTEFDKVYLFDGNSLNQGKKIKGIDIKGKQEMVELYKKEKYTIIITSLIYQSEIKNNIEIEFASNGVENPIICEII